MLAIVKSSVTLKTWAKYPPRSTKQNLCTPGYTRVSRTAPGLAQCMSRLHYPKLLKAEIVRSIFQVLRHRPRTAAWIADHGTECNLEHHPFRNGGRTLSTAQERIEADIHVYYGVDVLIQPLGIPCQSRQTGRKFYMYSIHDPRVPQQRSKYLLRYRR